MTQKAQSVVFHDNRELFKAYLPFIKTGGLFMPFNEDVTPTNIFPKQTIMVSLTLPNREKVAIQGQVCWINTSFNNKGYGIAFIDSAAMKHVKESIESEIAEFGSRRENVVAI